MQTHTPLGPDHKTSLNKLKTCRNITIIIKNNGTLTRVKMPIHVLGRCPGNKEDREESGQQHLHLCCHGNSDTPGYLSRFGLCSTDIPKEQKKMSLLNCFASQMCAGENIFIGLQ